MGVGADTAGNVFVAAGNRILKIDASGTISTLALAGYRNTTGGMAVDAVGNVYVADSGNNRVRRINASGTITTLAGTGEEGFGGDGGPATEAQFDAPTSVAADVAGNVYVADGRSVRKIDPSGQIATVVDGDDLRNPTAVVADEDGNVYVTSTPWCWVGLIAPDGTFDILIGLPGERVPDIALDESGDLVLARSTYLDRLETPPWRGYQVTTIARSHPKASFSYDSVAPIWARLSVHGLDVDRSGRVWFTGPEAGVIRVLEKNPY